MKNNRTALASILAVAVVMGAAARALTALARLIDRGDGTNERDATIRLARQILAAGKKAGLISTKDSAIFPAGGASSPGSHH